MDLQRIFDSFDDIFKLLNDIKSSDIISIAHNDMMTSLHMVYLRLSIFQTFMKSFRNSLLKPEKLNTDTYKNPLNNVSLG